MKRRKKNTSSSEVVDLNLDGPFPLTAAIIDAKCEGKPCGNYAVGTIEEVSRMFTPRYIGRSDHDLSGSLKKHVGGSGINGDYTHFMAAAAPSPKDAFERECKNYHDVQYQLDNEKHPIRTAQTDWECAVCRDLQASSRANRT